MLDEKGIDAIKAYHKLAEVSLEISSLILNNRMITVKDIQDVNKAISIVLQLQFDLPIPENPFRPY